MGNALNALLVNDASLAGHHGSAVVTQQIKRFSADAGMHVVKSVRLNDSAASLEENTFDVVLINGEGSLHSNSSASRMIAALSAKTAGRTPCYLINSCEADNDDDILRDVSSSRLLFVRDTASAARFRHLGYRSTVVPDLTLTAPLKRSTQAGPILVTDASNEERTRRLIAIARSHGSDMITLRTRPPAGAKRLAFAVKSSCASLTPAPLSPWSLRYGHWLPAAKLFARMETAGGIICGRYHAACFAIKMRIPFLAIEANARKTSSLLSDIGMTERLVHMDDLSSGLTPPPFSAIEIEKIDAFVESAERGAKRMFRDIVEDVLQFDVP